jgi:deazaflavin-dependent oxidoreductase (nitroreductase family)
MHPRRALVAAALVGAAVATATAEPISIRDQLLAVKDERECRITTRGRKTGKPHTVPVWFVADGDVLYLSTLDDTRDWVRNARKTPTVTVDFGQLAVTGQLRDVTDTDLDARVREALRHKYWLARVAGWFGKRPKRTFVIDHLAAVPPARPGS